MNTGFKNKKLKILICVLMSILLLICLAACKSDKNNNTDKNVTEDPNKPESASGDQTEEVDDGIKDSLPGDLNFDGGTLNIFAFNETELFAESENGDIINDAVFKRNRAVEERLNLKMNLIQTPPWQEYETTASMIRNSVLAGDGAYDLVYGWSAQMPHLSAEGLYLDFNEVPYLDLTAPWWAQSIIKEGTIANKLHFLIGDANLSMMMCYSAMLVNNQLQKEYGLPDIYEVVFDGKWTLDYMNNLVRDIYKDLNGNGAADENDQFGCAFDNVNQVDGFMQASNIKLISKDSDDIPYFDVEMEKVNVLVEKTYNLLYENPGVMTFAIDGSVSCIMDMFTNNQTLMVPIVLDHVVSRYKGMEADYSIIPYPKFDEAQDKYYSRIQDGATFLSVPVNCDKLEMVGAYMEAMGSESYKNLTPVYFDIAMKVKYTRDETSSKMLDIVREGAYLNFASIYNVRIGAPWNLLRNMMDVKKNNFTSWFERNEPMMKSRLNEVIDAMTK